jgi:plastocyanin
VNRDAFPHTVTAADKSFDSSSMDAGKQWVLVATKAGHFDYLCRFHPTMKGGLDVQ